MTEPRNLSARQQRNVRRTTASPPATRDNNPLVRAADNAGRQAQKAIDNAGRDIDRAVRNMFPPEPRRPLPRDQLRGKQKP